MQLLRFILVYLVGTTGIFAPAASLAQEDQPAEEGVILDLEALESLKEKEDGAEAEKTIYLVPYAPGAVKPSEAGQQDVARVAEATKNTMARLTILAYASTAEGESENDARRLALRRAIALRQILVAAGVDGARVNLQPMGLHPEGGEKSNQAEIIVRQP